MKVFNTLSGKKEDFVPVVPNEVKIYVCGPTVYNLIHIGNARPMIVFDTVRRYFLYKGYKVTYVSNFTDIDDKIIKRAIEEKMSSKEVATKYIKECEIDMEGMNIGKDVIHPLATNMINEMIEMIEKLIKKGHAYESSGTVYFRIKSFKEYGKLSKKNIDDLEAGHREIKVAGEENKEDPLDFVLWKPKKENEPYWESPWSLGRPGWHIECSAMAKKYLGDEIDIHAGGEDLIFPHHENEVAQSECCNGVPFAKYWLHNAFLKINDEKMSKSLGNFLTVRDVAKKYDLQVLRFFMLGAHYRTPINFSDELMESAKSGLERIKNAVIRLDELKAVASKEKKEESFITDKYKKLFEEAMDDDFNTALALSVIFDFVKDVNTNVDENFSKKTIENISSTLEELCDILGLKLRDEVLLDENIDKLIEERNVARANKDFALADKIRDDLLSRGIVLEDTKAGVRWKRI